MSSHEKVDLKSSNFQQKGSHNGRHNDKEQKVRHGGNILTYQYNYWMSYKNVIYIKNSKKYSVLSSIVGDNYHILPHI